MKLLVGGVVFLGALLLFAVEPMGAKVLLPVLGGASGVWLACLFFFQMVLLLGYGYAHWLVGRAGAVVGRVHAGMLGVGVVGLGLAGWGFGRWGAELAGWAGRHPAWAVPVLLGCGVGAPFFLLSATSPLVQGLWARVAGEGETTYGMFALSNAGSLLGLALYPAVLEPWLTLRQQEVGWATGFVGYAGLMGWLVWRLSHNDPFRSSEVSSGERAGGWAWAGATAGPFNKLRAGSSTAAAPSLRTKGGERAWSRLASVTNGSQVWQWRGMVVCLGAVASAQMGAVTGHLTQNVAAIPLLWVLPLGVYLVSFIVAFEAPGWYRRDVVVRLMVVMLASLGYLLSKTDVSLPIALGIGFFLVELFVATWFCHAEVYRLRPLAGAPGQAGARRATEFYLLLAGGGAVGTFCVGVLSPLVFRANYDLALVFAATAAMALWVTWEEGWGPRMLWTVSTVGSLVLVGLLARGYAKGSMVQLRNFYGSLRVRQSHVPPQAGVSRLLLNGQIEHGMQWFGGDWRTVPMTYYAVDSGVGRLLRGCCAGRSKKVGVVGLGAGTLAAYGRAGDAFRFYEINPLVTRLARELFTYERDSGARVTVVEGDARVSLAGEAPQGFDVLVVDAFSGDAIPVHLLTREAVELYRRHLGPGGVMAFHISNQYLDLEPVLREVARAEGMEAREVVSASEEARGEYKARWVLLTEDAGVFGRVGMEGVAERLPEGRKVRMWTDDYSSLLPLVEWGSWR